MKAEVYQSSRNGRIKPFKTFSVSTIFASSRDESWLRKEPKPLLAAFEKLDHTTLLSETLEDHLIEVKRIVRIPILSQEQPTTINGHSDLPLSNQTD